MTLIVFTGYSIRSDEYGLYLCQKVKHSKLRPNFYKKLLTDVLLYRYYMQIHFTMYLTILILYCTCKYFTPKIWVNFT
jgi:hypothetical protein